MLNRAYYKQAIVTPTAFHLHDARPGFGFSHSRSVCIVNTIGNGEYMCERNK